MKLTAKIIIGTLLILLGLLFLLETSGILAILHLTIAFLVGLLWPTLLIVLGVKLLTSNKSSIAGIFFLVVGVLFVLTTVFGWDFFSILWPTILILIGISVIFRNEESEEYKNRKVSMEDRIKEDLIFWGIDKKVDTDSFKGGEINAIFGGGKIDLSNAKIDKDGARLTINAIFGGIELIVPKDCKVVTNGTGILGGWDNKTSNKSTNAPVLNIDGAAVFGGVEIKN